MTTAANGMKVKALAPWFGSDRNVAAKIGSIIGRASWVGIPFAGGCSIISHIKTRSGVANDKHRHIINLARCVADDEALALLMPRLEGLLFHPDVLAEAQRVASGYEVRCSGGDGLFVSETTPTPDDYIDIEAAAAFFVCCWLGRSAIAGTNTEFRSGISTRFTSNGGDSCVRFRSAIDSLREWNKALLGWQFRCDDCFDFLDRCKDEDEHALYIDAPWPDDGDGYKYQFTPEQQKRLAIALGRFKTCRIVIRFRDHPLVRELYPVGSGWWWVGNPSRSQTNKGVEEVLIVNQPGAAQ